MKIVSGTLMRQIDSAAIAGKSADAPAIHSLTLMENAGQAVARAILADLAMGSGACQVAMFCGAGNNGGDGFVIARALAESARCHVTIFVLSGRDGLSPDAQVNFDRWVGAGGAVQVITDTAQVPRDIAVDIIVDALFGTGFHGQVSGVSAEIINWINASSALVCAVDIPSGIHADGGASSTPSIRADFTYALGLPKIGHFVYPGREFSGVIKIIDIGISQSTISSFGVNENLITTEQVAELIPERAATVHKGQCGRLAVIAGSAGMVGAAAMSARSAMRSGVGVVTIACPESVAPTLATKLDEVMIRALPDVANKGALSLRALGNLLSVCNNMDAAIIGPGLGQHRQTKELIQRFVAKLTIPFVLDADGLNAFEGNVYALEASHAPAVLTPHEGEYARLVGAPPPREFAERARDLQALAKRFGSVIVLKGAPTLVATQEGELYINPTGNPAMATAGSGDVLAGVIGALLAQGKTPAEAAIAGVFIHGRAGDIAAQPWGGRGMIAGDIIDALPQALSQIADTSAEDDISSVA